MVYQVIYRSSARDIVLPEGLNDLLKRARARNEIFGVSGLLLYSADTFLQVLEGDEATVKRLYKRIENDKRHTNMQMLWSGSAESPEFGGWWMGYTHPDAQQIAQLPDFSQFFDRSAGEDGPSRAKKLLLSLTHADSDKMWEVAAAPAESDHESAAASQGPAKAVRPAAPRDGDDLFFGQFLRANGVVTEVQLLQVVAYQKGRNRLLGELAVDLGLLTEEQVSHGRAEQKRRDVMFGDAVVELGYIEKNKLEELLQFQQRTHIFIGEVVAKLGFAKKEVVEKHLAQFEGDFVARAERLVAFEGADHIWLETLTSLTEKILSRVCGIPSHLGFHEALKRGTELHLFRFSAGGQIGWPWTGSFIFSASERVAEKIMRSLSAGTTGQPPNVNAATAEVVRLIGSLGKEPPAIELKGEVNQIEGRVMALAGSCGAVAELLTPFGAAHVVLVIE